ncbi:hypothetical protein CCHR01_06200 [Colletotrichum chrysophilum]|uniref:Uncharacterized protein n=1 Tax=Colletotrichum chrysophilum TaxID=1836956 RepID=A0AAD9AR73_9PEZI|nr:hypothetical protein CCHR01_06200 [Colletotrichum chrysophilum]
MVLAERKRARWTIAIERIGQEYAVKFQQLMSNSEGAGDRGSVQNYGVGVLSTFARAYLILNGHDWTTISRPGRESP